MTKRIYFVRHGETYANHDNLVPDRDAELHSNGHMQAAKLAARMENISVEALLVSGFIRTHQSAEPLLKATGLTMEIHPEFNEYLEPKKYIGLPDSGPEVVEYRRRRNELVDTNPKWTEAEEESLADFFKRQQVAKKILEDHLAENIVVLCHGFFLMSFISQIILDTDKPSSAWLHVAKKLKFSNMGITLCTYDEGAWRIITLNDHAHFAE